MKPPIVVDGKGDLLLFRDVREAEGYLESEDVSNQEYPAAYDSEGRLLRLRVREQEKRVLGVFKPSSDDVVIEPAEEQPSHADHLRRLLVERLRSVEGDPVALEKQSTEQLLELAARRYGYL